MSRHLKLIISIAIFHSALCNGQTSNAGLAKKADEYLMALQSLNRFRGAVLIAKNGIPVYQRAFGLANIEDSVFNTVNTRFPVASITKSFTATAILILKEKGLLNLDDRITKYIKPGHSDWNNITIHHLLSHSSGIPDYSEDSLWLTNRSCGTSFHETINLFKNKKLLFPPGSKYNYSNSGYVLLGYISEELSGMSYDRFVATNILKPLAMNNTFVDDNKSIILKRARGYVREGLELQNFPYLNMQIGKPAGAIVSTVGDLLKWDQSFNTNKLLSDKSKKNMFTIYAGDYGYGWHIDSLHGQKRITHSGGILGYKTNIDRFPDEKLTIIMLCNSYDVFINSAIRDLAAIALNKKYNLPQKRKSIALTAEKLRAYIGIYMSKDGQTFKIRQAKNATLEVEYNAKVYDLQAETETNFFSSEYDGQLMFTFSFSDNTPYLTYNKKVKALKQ
jgi:CubicO group peptidase (beta-lactamase class C family)